MWAVRAGCAAAVAGAVVLARCIPVPVAPAASVDLCPVLQIIASAALYDRVPPPGAGPELGVYVERMNADMAYVRSQIEETCP